ncbi:hypothetical protein KGQ20_04095 [Catenulispora sp. NF23]|uniref:Uncharacterized protein n=1 Tax=Catenulispora pinistramenti TaxID=2705254 RepID=A0ABS5KIJ6_9ACTN|nr:hypothetical protein [Catenulispora pinistramenti]MBS2531945.1 hypothetical protein [Catenulispora pinistramenti]MBS2546212.1 hypothetical protein [Catenulispora pinistramenti]
MPDQPDDNESSAPVPNSPEPETTPPVPGPLAALKAARRAVLKARRTPHSLGPVWLLLTTAGVYLAGAGVWALLQLHGTVRIATASGVSALVLLGAWLRRQGWLG